jgi:Fe-S cluster assembly iron-binding protein IscA
MITTAKAAQKLRDSLMQKFLLGGIGFRFSCHGLDASRNELSMQIDRERPTDTVVQVHGIKILLAPDVAGSLDGCTLDYREARGGFYLDQRNHLE